MIEGGDFASVNCGDNCIVEAFVADRGGGGDDLGQNDDFFARGEEFFLEGVVVEQAGWGVVAPFWSPFQQIGTGEFLKDESAHDEEVGSFFKLVGGHPGGFWVTAFRNKIQIENFLTPADFDRHVVPGERFCGDEIAEREASIIRVDEVAIGINFASRNREKEVAFAESGFFGRTARRDASDEDAGRVASGDIVAELGIAKRGKTDADTWEGAVFFGFCSCQKSANNHGWDDIGGLIASVVAHEQTNEAALMNGGDNIAALALLDGAAEPVNKQADILDEIAADCDGGESHGGGGDFAIRFELQNLDAFSDLEGVRKGQGNGFAEEFRIGCAQESEIALVINRLDFGGDAFSGGRAFQFHVGVVEDEFSRYQNLVFAHDDSESTAGEGLLLHPGAEEVPALAGCIDAKERARERSLCREL